MTPFCGADIVFQTDRLFVRRISENDFADMCKILQCPVTMRFYEHAFSDDEVAAWLTGQLERYGRFGFGLWAVIRKADGLFIGQAGLTWQNVEGAEELEIGYLFNKDFWHRGYATEAAKGCMEYAFRILERPRVVSTIRDINLPSRAVAVRVGMKYEKTFIKRYYGMDMPHDVYAAER